MTAVLLGALAGFVLGALVGSFLATIVVRWPQGRSVADGRSQCDSCGTKIGVADLVPLASAVLRRGQCRACGARIDPVHARIELVAAAVGAIALGMGPGFTGLALAVFGWLLIPLGFLDWRHLWLPNRLVLTLALAGIAGGRLLGLALTDQLIGGAAGVASLALIAALYHRIRGREGMGKGDPKLLGAIGLWLGWQALAPLLVLAAGLGILLALATRRGPSDQVAFGTMLALAAWPVALVRLA